MYLTERVLIVLDLGQNLSSPYTSGMAAHYPPSTKRKRLYLAVAAACAAAVCAALRWNWVYAPVGLLGLVFCTHRALLYAQRIELTRTGIICRSPLGERRLAYQHITCMRFSLVTGDLVLERPWVRLCIPRSYKGRSEIRRAVSLAVWAHRGGDVPPDLANADSAFI